jgi:glycosyltransferase involved in cell wall biosynthesis
LKGELTIRLEASGLFDAEWYCREYPDAAASDSAPLTHFLCYGLDEGRAPGPKFDPEAYLAANSDVARAGQNALRHYLMSGQAEGRILARPSLWPEAPLPEYLPDWFGRRPGNTGGRVQRILYVLSIQSGGTPQTNQDLMNTLHAHAECLVLRCVGRKLVLYLFQSGIYAPLEHHELVEPVAPFPHASAEYDDVVARWLDDYGVTLVHIRHLAWQGLGVTEVAHRHGVPVVCSFHDYYAICPSVKLLDEHQQFCGGRCTASRGECSQELWAPELMPALKHEGIYTWQQQFAGALALCDGAVTTTEAARSLLLSIFPFLEDRPFAVIPHGRDFSELVELAECPAPGNKLRVLVPGHIARAKGAEILLALSLMPVLGHVEWHVLGTIDDTLNKAQGWEWPGSVVVHGAYQREAFHRHVAEIRPHLGAVLSIWPETWCHTLTELWSVGVPVIGFDIGAVGERLHQTGAGWPVSALTAEAVAEALQMATISAEWQLRAEKVIHWQREKQVSCSHMADAYWRLYQQVQQLA